MKKLIYKIYQKVMRHTRLQLIEIAKFPDRHFWHGGYDKAMRVAARVQKASTEVLAGCEGSVFITNTVHDDLAGSQWYSRLRPVVFKQLDAHFGGSKVYRRF